MPVPRYIRYRYEPGAAPEKPGKPPKQRKTWKNAYLALRPEEGPTPEEVAAREAKIKAREEKMAQWELEEQKRASVERSRRRQERERQDREQYRERLRQELTALRRKEVETGVKLDADKALVKRQLREIASRSQTDSGH